MSDQYLGEIRIVPFNFAPVGWALCNGQLLPISQNTALFSLLGIYYGGDGIQTFGLPNLQGSTPLNFGQGSGLSAYNLGEVGGVAAVELLETQIPNHTHVVSANAGNGDLNNPANNTWAKPHLGKTPINIYSSTLSNGLIPGLAMNPVAFALTGGNVPHNNMPPYLTLSFIIALEGVFPPRS